jgi:hypothetical protein
MTETPTARTKRLAKTVTKRLRHANGGWRLTWVCAAIIRMFGGEDCAITMDVMRKSIILPTEPQVKLPSRVTWQP